MTEMLLIVQGLGNIASVIQITNAEGKQLLSYKTGNDLYKTNVKALKPNIYYLTIWQTNKVVFTSRFIKE